MEAIAPHQTFQTVFHISDLHIHNATRTEEYQQVFKQLLETIRQHPKYHPDTSLIINTGDTLDKAGKMTAEAIQLLQDLRQQLSQLAFNVWIPGNHDMRIDQLQTSQVDALSAILAENHTGHNFLYLKEAKSILLGTNLTISHLSVKEVRPNGLTPSQLAQPLPTDRTKIALFHGILDKTTAGDGYLLRDCEFRPRDFQDFQLTLLGDVHRYQSPSHGMAYAGSLIQQSFGEDPQQHGGCLVWNLADQTHQFLPIHNDYGSVTLQVSKGQLVAPPTQLPKYTRLRLVYDLQTTTPQLEKIRATLAESTKIIQTRTVPNSKARQQIETPSKDPYTMDEQLLEYLAEYYPPELHEALFDLDQQYKAEAGFDNLAQLATETTQLMHLAYSNLFVYRGQHQLPIGQLQTGIKSIYGANRQGKSKLVDILLISLFGCPPKSCQDVISHGTKLATSQITFQRGDTLYRIQRTFQTKKTSVLLETSTDGDWVSDSRLTKPQTEKRIQELLGKQDILEQTSISKQDQHQAFLNLTTEKRKALLKRILDTEQYDRLGTAVRRDLDRLRTDTIAPLKGQLAEIRKSIQDNQTTPEQLAETKTQLEAHLQTRNTLENDLAKAQERKIQLRGLQTSRQHLTDNLPTLLQTSLGSEAEYQEKTKMLETQRDTLRQTIQAKTERLQGYQARIIPGREKASQQLQSLQDTIATSETTIQEAEQRLAKEKTQLQQQEAEADSVTETIQLLKGNLESLPSQQNFSHGSQAEFQTALQTLDKQIEAIQIPDAVEPVSEQDYDTYLQNSTLAKQLEARFDSHQHDISRLQQRLDRDPFQYNEFCQDCQHNQETNHIPQTQAQLQSLRREIHDLQTQLNTLSLDPSIPERYQLDHHRERALLEQEKLTVQRERLTAEYEKFTKTKQRASLATQITALDTKRTQINHQIKQHKQSVESGQTQLNQAQLAQATAQAQLPEAQQAVQDYQNNLRLTKKISSLETRLAQLAQTDRDYQLEAKVLEDDYAGLIANQTAQAKHQLLTQQIQEIDQQITETKRQETPEQIQNKMKPIQTQLEALQRQTTLQETSLQAKLTAAERQEQLEVTLGKAEAERATLQKYYEVTRNFPEQHIRNSAQHLADEANLVLLNLNAGFSIHLDSDTLDFCKRDGQTSTNIQYCSGFERFALAMALRYALTRIGHTPRIDTLIIDEGFGVLDQTHLANITNWLEPLENIYTHLCIVTHIEQLQERLSRKIHVQAGTLSYQHLLVK